MKTYTIETPTEDEHPELIHIWESSVKATHHFLKKGDIDFYKALIEKEYLYLVDLICAKNENGKILGFMGISENNLEMLFIHADERKKGIGKFLLKHAIELGVSKVDVNEQNQQAVGFYERFGFRIENRSELDGKGKPYPILHMSL